VTIADWVAERGTGAPAQLRAGVRVALGSDGSRPVTEAAEVLLGVAERDLALWLTNDSASRAGAVPLLTIDVLVTLALEAAAEHRVDVDAVADAAILRLSALAGSGGSRSSDSRFPTPDVRIE
jgi:hypothetical protein